MSQNWISKLLSTKRHATILSRHCRPAVELLEDRTALDIGGYRGHSGFFIAVV